MARRLRTGETRGLPLEGFSFVGVRRWTYIASGLLILIGLISMALQGLNLGVDFTGGSILELDYADEVAVSQVEEVLARHPGMEGALVQLIGNEEQQLLRVRSRSLPSGQEREAMYASLAELGDFEIAMLDEVSPTIGRELTRAGFLALAVAILGMIAYITVRFEFRFAVSAIAALLHDSLITLGLFSLFRVEVDQAFIVAILVIVGYSVNDTIVVFDRIRENLRYRERGEELSRLVDRSLRQTLMRSLATSATTFVAIGALWLFGGASLRNFTAALLLGVIVGTYSSIFVASPIWLSWQQRRPAKLGSGG